MKRIMVIDDDHEIREMLKQMLEREGYEVVEAPDGVEGIKVYRQNPAPLRAEKDPLFLQDILRAGIPDYPPGC